MNNTQFHLNTRRTFYDEWRDEEIPPAVASLYAHLWAVGASIAPLSQPSGRHVERWCYSRSSVDRCSRSLPYVCIRKQTAHDKGKKEDKKWIKNASKGVSRGDKDETKVGTQGSMIWTIQQSERKHKLSLSLSTRLWRCMGEWRNSSIFFISERPASLSDGLARLKKPGPQWTRCWVYLRHGGK
jgi:hypothetical protein